MGRGSQEPQHTPVSLTPVPWRWAEVAIPTSASGTAPRGRVPCPRSQSEVEAGLGLGSSLGKPPAGPGAHQFLFRQITSNRKLGPEPLLFQGHKPDLKTKLSPRSL